MVKFIKSKNILVALVLMASVVSSNAAIVTLAWNPSVTTVSGAPIENVSYKLFYGTSPSSYDHSIAVGVETTATITGLQDNQTYYFSVKAYVDDSASAYSEELNWDSLGAPSYDNSTDVTIGWDPSLTTISGAHLANISSYTLFYGDSPSEYNRSLSVNNGNTEATVMGLEYNKTYYFAVKAYTTENSESDYSEELVWGSPNMPDTDADNISDNWEIQYTSNLETMQASTDIDMDGISDFNEFIAGTNPSDPNEFPSISIQANAMGITISFEAKQAIGNGYENRERRYTLMRCEDLLGGNWTAVPGLENILAGGQTENIKDEMGSHCAYYRTEVWLQ